MKDISLKKVLLTLLAVLMLGAGIGMFVKVGIGVDALSAFEKALSNLTGLTLGTVCALCNVFFVIATLIINKKFFGIASIIFILVSKFPVDFAEKVMITTDNLFINILLAIISIAVLAFGSELFILSGLGANAYDGVCLAIQSRLKKEVKYVYLRYAVDGTFLILAIILGGQIGIGTVMCWASMGIFMKFFEGVIKKIFRLN